MPTRLLIAAGEAADSADALPFGVRELIDTADEVLVVTPTLPTRFEWLASATDKAREQADERLQAVLGQIEELGTQASGTVGADDPLLAFEDALAAFHADHILVGLRPPDHADWQERDCSTSCFAGWNSSHGLLAARVALWTRSCRSHGNAGDGPALTSLATPSSEPTFHGARASVWPNHGCLQPDGELLYRARTLEGLTGSCAGGGHCVERACGRLQRPTAGSLKREAYRRCSGLWSQRTPSRLSDWVSTSTLTRTKGVGSTRVGS